MLDKSRSEYVRDILESRHRTRNLERQLEKCRNRIESREKRIAQLETELRRRSQIEGRIDELAIEVREQSNSLAPPFWVRWARWFRERE